MPPNTEAGNTLQVVPASQTLVPTGRQGYHGHSEPSTKKQEEEFLRQGMRLSLQAQRTPREESSRAIVPIAAKALATPRPSPPQNAPLGAQQRLQPHYTTVQSAFSDPNVQRILATRSDAAGVDPKFLESVDTMRKMSFAKALGGSIGNTVSMNPEEAQPEWAPLIKQAGLLFRKMNSGVWAPGVFFVYNGFFVGCEVHPAGTERVELATLDLQVSLTGYGVDPKPLPLEGCKIFAGEGVREFQIQIEIPGAGGKRKAIDLAAETEEVREQWIEEIFKGANVGDGYGSRGEYVPKAMRGQSPSAIKKASQAEKHGTDVWNKARDAASTAAKAGRSCADDAGCPIM